MIICTQTVSMKEELRSFSIMKDLGATDNHFLQISLIKNLLICVSCVPFALCLSLLTVYVLTKISYTTYNFYVSTFSVIISVLLPFALTTVTTLISAIIIKRGYSGSNRTSGAVFQLKENKSFWLRYALKDLTVNMKDNVLMVVTVSLSICCLSAFIYTTSICSINLVTRDFQLSRDNSFITVYANGKNAGIYEDQLETLRSLSFIEDALAEASYYSEFIMNAEQSEFLMQKLDSKDISRLFAVSRITEYLRADLLYTENFNEILSSYGGNVVEGDILQVFSDTNLGMVAVVDACWTENGENCYHIGDEILIRNCKFNRSESSYTPIDENTITLTVGAIIKPSVGDVYNNYTSFPLYVGFETYKQITGYDRYKKLYIYCEPENYIEVERNLNHIFYTSEYGDGQLVIVNQFDGYNNDRFFTQRIYGFLNSIAIVLTVLVFVSVVSLGHSRVVSKNADIRVLLNIGVPKTEFIKISILKSLVYTVVETVIASVINSFVLKAVFNMFRASNVFSAETQWEYPTNIFLFTAVFCLVINIISEIVLNLFAIKNEEVDSYVENQ